MCSTCSGSGPAIDLHCVQSDSADMDVNREDPYCSPVKDEETAIRRSMMNLRDIEVRCFKAAPMCYESLSENESKAFRVRCAGAAVSGVLALLSGARVTAPIERYLEIKILQSMKVPYIIGTVFAFLVFAGALKGIETIVPSGYEKKAEQYNRAAAEWQQLELKITAFLAAAIEGQITAKECKAFTEHCAKKRKKICLIACPDQSIYKKYESDNNLVESLIKRKKTLRKFHKRLQEEGLF
ncbi:uncharacterized protein LOC124112814 [Haliotis rufescens]|uniref:uncharacterized protein LOC124112814 n=1 Tax=Haliotis rufescens TaxID=6454 RepID=UPI00201EE099|nr:uncharacterized protein LOC124112814 [Haliotis rufescens]